MKQVVFYSRVQKMQPFSKLNTENNLKKLAIKKLKNQLELKLLTKK